MKLPTYFEGKIINSIHYTVAGVNDILKQSTHHSPCYVVKRDTQPELRKFCRLERVSVNPKAMVNNENVSGISITVNYSVGHDGNVPPAVFPPQTDPSPVQ